MHSTKREHVNEEHALRKIKAFELYFNRFDNFQQTFILLIPEEHDLNCLHEVMLKPKPTHIHTHKLIIVSFEALSTKLTFTKPISSICVYQL